MPSFRDSLVPDWLFDMPADQDTHSEREPRSIRGDPSVRLPTFSGEDKDAHLQFVTWQFDVLCYQREGRAENEILSAIRRSLRGAAARTLVNLGIDASVSQILSKFKQVFSPVLSSQAVLHQFYSLRQQHEEDARTFAGRLEDAIFQAVRVDAVQRGDAKSMLLEAFKHGLCASTKLATGHLFLNAKAEEFDDLVSKVKLREEELRPVAAAAAAHSIQTAPVELTQLSEGLLTLSAQVSQCMARLDEVCGVQNQQSQAGENPQKKRKNKKAMVNGAQGSNSNQGVQGQAQKPNLSNTWYTHPSNTQAYMPPYQQHTGYDFHQVRVPPTYMVPQGHITPPQYQQQFHMPSPQYQQQQFNRPPPRANFNTSTRFQNGFSGSFPNAPRGFAPQRQRFGQSFRFGQNHATFPSFGTTNSLDSQNLNNWEPVTEGAFQAALHPSW